MIDNIIKSKHFLYYAIKDKSKNVEPYFCIARLGSEKPLLKIILFNKYNKKNFQKLICTKDSPKHLKNLSKSEKNEILTTLKFKKDLEFEISNYEKLLINWNELNPENEIFYETPIEEEGFFLTPFGKEDTNLPMIVNLRCVHFEDEQEIFLRFQNDKEDKMNMTQTTENNNPPLNQILYGPPGTGKTYNTVVKAMQIICQNEKTFEDELLQKLTNSTKDSKIIFDNEEYKKLKEKFDELKKAGQIEFVTFHQSYSYEEFVEGIKPDMNNADWETPAEQLNYVGKNGIFKKICKDAAKHTTDNFDEVYEQFTNRIASCDEDDFYKIYTLKNNKVFGLKMNSNNNLNVYLSENFNKQGVITKENLRNYFEHTRKTKDWENYYASIVEHLKKEYNLFSQKTENKPHVLIIDEINRGNISKIFGELITLIEPDKRKNVTGDNPEKYHTITATLPYSQQPFTVPNNLYIIGTMNTADKSLALLDVALRRRFEFVAMYPKYHPEIKYSDENMSNFLQKLNDKILDKKRSADYMIGHSYFMNSDITKLPDILNNKVIPLLMEYFNGKVSDIKKILDEIKIVELTFDEKYKINNEYYRLEIIEAKVKDDKQATETEQSEEAEK